MVNLLASLDLAQHILLGDFHIVRFVLQLLLFATSLWLIFLVLIQRGKGGGLTGALGGSGGSSAFGAKAGDAFTRVTVVSASIWIFLCMVTIAYVNPPPAPSSGTETPSMTNSSASGDSETPAAPETNESATPDKQDTDADDSSDSNDTSEPQADADSDANDNSFEIDTPEPAKDNNEASAGDN